MHFCESVCLCVGRSYFVSASICVCVCAFLWVYVCWCMCVCYCALVCVCVCVCVCRTVCAPICVFALPSVCLCVCLPASVHAYVCVFVCECVYLRASVRVCVLACVCVCVCVCEGVFVCLPISVLKVFVDSTKLGKCSRGTDSTAFCPITPAANQRAGEQSVVTTLDLRAEEESRSETHADLTCHSDGGLVWIT